MRDRFSFNDLLDLNYLFYTYAHVLGNEEKKPALFSKLSPFFRSANSPLMFPSRLEDDSELERGAMHTQSAQRAVRRRAEKERGKNSVSL